MFALIAALIFFLALLGVEFGDVNMMMLGLMFVAIHLAFSWWPFPTPWRRNSP
jgi:hypothetical protein